jgi:quinoprotein glucose dehydrogenase
MKIFSLKFIYYIVSIVIVVNLFFFIYFNYKALKILKIDTNKKAYCFFYNKYKININFLDIFNCVNNKRFILNYEYFDNKKLKEISKNDNSYVVKGDTTVSKIESDIKKNNNWYRSHKNESSNKFYETNKINEKNVNKLKVKWKYDLKGNWKDRNNFLELLYAKIFYTYTGYNPYNPINNIHGANPIFYKGNLYLPDLLGNIISIDGSNGKNNWKRKLPVPVAKRGATIDTSTNSLFVPSGEGIFQIDPLNGKIIDQYKVKEKFFNSTINKYNALSITGSNVFLVPPIVSKDQLIGVNMNSEVVSFSLEKKEVNWMLNLRKDNLKSGARPWSAMSFDENRNHLYVVTGNPQTKNSFMLGIDRVGDNLYSNSVVCIDIITNKILWHFQDTSHDLWDFDVSFPPILSSINFDNKIVDILVIVSKSGNTFIINRETGKNVFDYEMLRVKQSEIKGEFTSSHQKRSLSPLPLMDIKIDIKELSAFTEDIKEFNLKNFKDGASNNYIPPILNKKIFIRGVSGGGQWYGGSIDTSQNILYVPVNNIPWELKLSLKNKIDNNEYNYNELSEFNKKNNNYYYQSNAKYFYDQYKNFATKPPWGFLYAINLKNGKILWKRPYGKIFTKISQSETKLVSGSPIWGGIATISSGVIVASGSFDSNLYFYNTKKGDEIHSIQLDAPGSSPPVIYDYNGNIFVSVVAVGAAQTVNKGRYIYGIGF